MPVAQLGCPMCGRYFPVNYFLETDFEPVDIPVKVQSGAGRGRGFVTISESSGFDRDDATQIVVQRTKKILNLLSKHGYNLLPDKVILRLRGMIAKIEDALGEDYSGWMPDEHSYNWVEILSAGLEQLIDEFHSAAALAEESESNS